MAYSKLSYFFIAACIVAKAVNKARSIFVLITVPYDTRNLMVKDYWRALRYLMTPSSFMKQAVGIFTNAHTLGNLKTLSVANS